jgi:Raf kinase inhibitor-like YbhB/YbcL family protein
MRRFLLALLVLVSCNGDEPPAPRVSPIAPDLDQFTLSSPAFEEGAEIPPEFTCDGPGIPPPIEWSGVPEGTAELILTLLDPDAPEGVFTHWTVYGIPPEAGGLPEGAPPEGASEGLNDFGDAGYGGPCPPGPEPHRYIFTLAALTAASGLEAGADPSAVDAFLQRAIATTTLTGQYPA